MAGTLAGGKVAKATNLKNDPDFFKKIGRLGGRKGAVDGVIKGFAAVSYEKRVESGRKGGLVSRRDKNRAE